MAAGTNGTVQPRLSRAKQFRRHHLTRRCKLLRFMIAEMHFGVDRSIEGVLSSNILLLIIPIVPAGSIARIE